MVLLLQKVEGDPRPAGAALHAPLAGELLPHDRGGQLQTGASGARAVRLEAHAVVPDGELAEGAPAVELDADPSRLAGGKDVYKRQPYTHELPLENYYGPAVCLDIPKKHWELITVEDIEKAADKVEGGIQEGDWVLICTGMNQRWGENDDYFMYSPGMSIEGAHWLVDHKVKGVGFDLQALDHILYTYAAQHGPSPYVPRIVDEYKKEFGHEPIEDYPEWEPVHTILLGNNVMGIENLGGDIEKVKGQRFMFCAFPLRWYMGDGTIVRAVAITDEDHINKDVPDRVYKYGVY